MSKKIALACTGCLNRNYSTNTTKSAETVRLEMRKFCKTCGTHTLHRETK